MDNNVFAPFATSDENGNVSIDLNSFISRILLFDHYTVETMLMRDIALLINNFGIEGLRDLINSGVVSLHSDATTMGQFESENPANDNISQPTNAQHSFIPFNHYDLVIVSMPNREEYIGHGLQNINALNLPIKRAQKLKKSIVENLTNIPVGPLEMVPWTREALLTNGSVVKTATLNAIKLRHGTTVAEDALRIKFEPFAENGFQATSNLQDLLKIDVYEEHKIIERAILSTGGFFQRLSLMKSYDSIAWFSEADSKLLNDEMKAVAHEVDSSMQENRLTRILQLKGLPSIRDDQYIDVNKLMNLRDSRECRQFRDWLRTSDAKTDVDILREINSYRSAFATALGTGPSRVARFLLSTAVGTINPPAGIAMSVADQFILDKILKKNGPISFINNSLPRLGD